MFSKSKFNTCFFLLLMAANMSIAQYFNHLYDVDSSIDWGRAIFVRDDGNYFITGNGSRSTAPSRLLTAIVSPDGNIIHSLDTFSSGNNGGWYQGEWGNARKLPLGGYVSPFTVQYPNPTTGYLYSAGGFVRYKEDGDTVFVKSYTDTATQFVRILNCDVMQDGGYIGGGACGLNVPSYYPAFIVRSDSAGDTLWTRTYQKSTTQYAEINSIVALTDNRIVAGAHTRYNVTTPALDVYYHFSPWFMLLDGGGHVIRDTVYGPKYGGGGRLYRDTIGGYAHIGQIDTLAYPLVPDSYRNLPCYIAHLDTNFRMSWETRFPYTENGRRHPMVVKQLHDGNYLAVGATEKGPHIWAWAAKVNRNTGAIIWDWYYNSDSTNDNYFSDAAEKPDGSLVFVGASFNDTLPSYRRVFDVWLLGTDSNGCPSPLCFTDTSTTATHVVQQPVDFTLFPNPTNGGFTINAPYPGNISVCDFQGRVVFSAILRRGNNDLNLPPGLSPGMYLCRYVSDKGESVVVKLAYQP